MGAERAGECDGLTGLPEATRGHLAPVRGPDLRGYHRSAPPCGSFPTRDHEEGRRCSQAHPHRAGRGGGPWGLGGLRRVRPRARYPQTVATWERAQAGSRRSQSFPPTGRRVVSPPLAREVPPPPTLLSPRATNCARATKNRGHYSPPTRPQLNYCGQQTRNSDERAQERDKDQGKPASKRTAPPRLIQGQLTTNWKQALAQLTTAYPDRITPYL